MFEIKIRIEAPEIVGALNKLADSMKLPEAVLQVSEPVSAPAPADPVTPDPAPEKATSKSKKEGASTPAKKAELVKEEKKAEPVKEEKKPEPVKEEKKVIDLDAIARAGASLIDAGKMPQIMELLKKYGVQAVTQLKTEQYEGFAKDLSDLGANI